MKILNSKSFIKLNEQQVVQDITPITDEIAIKNMLSYLDKETERYSLNHEGYKESVFDKTNCQKCDELTRQFASLDISYELLKKKEISNHIANIFYNSVTSYYKSELDDNLCIEEASDEWCDDEPGEPGRYSTFYTMSYEFDETLNFIIGENYALRTYNFQILYDEDKNNICIYYDGYTPTGEWSAFADEYDKLPNEFIPIDNDLDLLNDLEVIYDECCDELKDNYDPSDY